jgi:hypothetical protein
MYDGITMESHRQVAYFQNPLAHYLPSTLVAERRGSKASRTASPMKINKVNMMSNVKKPDNPSQGA